MPTGETAHVKARGTAPDSGRVQRRTLAVLSLALVLGGLGASGAVTGGGLLVVEVSGQKSLAGLGQTSIVLGSALMAVPLARLSSRYGRRAGLAGGYGLGAVGALVVLAAAAGRSTALLLMGLVLFGSAVAAGLQSRFAATDLSEPTHVGRDLSIVVWMTSIGAVAGPNVAQPAAATAEMLDLPSVAGIFVWAGAGFVLATLLVTLLLRPDPLLVARRNSGASHEGSVPRPPLRQTFTRLTSGGPTRLAVGTLVLAQATMVGLMVMTPLHLDNGGADLAVVGLVISVHVAGMFLFSPLVGLAADRLGPVPVIAVGALTMVASGVLAALAPAQSSTAVGLALFLLGLGWSFCSVAGAALLTESVPDDMRPHAQGATDLAVGLAAATAGALAGVVVGVWSYGALGAAVAVLIVPVALAAVSHRRLGRHATA